MLQAYTTNHHWIQELHLSLLTPGHRNLHKLDTLSIANLWPDRRGRGKGKIFRDTPEVYYTRKLLSESPGEIPVQNHSPQDL